MVLLSEQGLKLLNRIEAICRVQRGKALSDVHISFLKAFLCLDVRRKICKMLCCGVLVRKSEYEQV